MWHVSANMTFPAAVWFVLKMMMEKSFWQLEDVQEGNWMAKKKEAEREGVGGREEGEGTERKRKREGGEDGE